MKFDKLFTILIIPFIFISIAQGQSTSEKTGCIEGRCDNGYGTFIYKDGTKYKGEFKNGLAEGTGTCFYENGDYYFGEWSKHTYHGKGMLQFENGEKLEGSWTNGEFQNIYLSDVINQNSLTSKTWVIIIGISQYDNYTNLKYSDDDAHHLYSFLKSPEGGSIPEANIQLLIDDAASEVAIFESLDKLAAQTDTNDNILVYFSGHGIQGAFLPANYDQRVGNQLHHQAFLARISKCKAKNKFIIANVYNTKNSLLNNTYAEKGGSNSSVNQNYPSLKITKSNTVLILAASSDEISLENEGMHQSTFNYFVIEGLKGKADANNDDIVTLEEIFNYTQEEVQDNTHYQESLVLIGNFDKNYPISRIK